MKTETRTCIITLLNVDPTISRPVRQGILQILQNGVRKERKLLRVVEAAKQLDVHPKTLLRYGREGRIELLKLSRRKIMIRSEELERFITEAAGTPAPG